ncbi:MAG: nucleoside hydrolase [Acidobacteriota bacterium]|nr:nucleoside hydrolase [Acidobacteriota bacterium]
MTATRVLIDTDPGIDDAAAILLALASPEAIDLLGLTTVAGNVALPKTTRNAIRIRELAGVDIPVAAGAPAALIRPALERGDAESVHGEDGFGGWTHAEATGEPVAEHAIDFIARLSDDGPLTIVGIGPLTNVALLLARHPDIVERIERFVIMGGARLEGNASAAAEFNIWLDPEAAARVFSSGIPITMFPLDITRQATMRVDEVDELSRTGEIGRTLADLIRFYHVGEHDARPGDFLAPLHDVLTTLYLTNPQAMTYVDAAVTVDCGDSISRGATLVDTSGRPASVKNVSVGVDLDRDTFARMLIDGVRELELRRGTAS